MYVYSNSNSWTDFDEIIYVSFSGSLNGLDSQLDTRVRDAQSF